ncbi:MAG: hypothetical protein Q7K16_03540 [Candidatus Azambacteria bacterium]|nr:hypothetical protein [Candidatus Azambacteria bacterium]
MKNGDKKFIGLDLDGVIINHASLKIKLAKKFGFKLRPEETPSEIMETIVGEQIFDKMQMMAFSNPKFFNFAPLMPGVKLGLASLKKNKLPFVLISRRREPSLAIASLKFHGLWPKFFNEKNAFFVVKPEDKNIKAREMGVTHYADDETGILEKLVDVKNRFLFDNLGVFQNTDGYTRVKSWKELVGHFLK